MEGENRKRMMVVLMGAKVGEMSGTIAGTNWWRNDFPADLVQPTISKKKKKKKR